MIEEVLKGTYPKAVVEAYLETSTNPPELVKVCRHSNTSKNGSIYIKSFFDAYGQLQFAHATENYLIKPDTDPRLFEIYQISENLSVDSNLIDLLSSYEGSIEALYQIIRNQVSLADELQ
jgi:hypothetical protein